MATVTSDTPTGAIHSCVIQPHLKKSLSEGITDKYGRLFPNLPPLQVPEEVLLALGRSGAVMDQASDAPGGDNPLIPSGFTFLGQFIAHDITADRSMIQHHANVDEIHNFRTPRLDLESVYASGPSGSTYIYDRGDSDKFLLGINNAGNPDDLPRNSQSIALIGDPRNDVHQLIAQLHVAFLKFHNNVVDYVRQKATPAENVFDEAQRMVRWHYQWIVVHEFLPQLAGREMMEDIVRNGPRFFTYEDHPFIPVEFSDAAYRYGHSQVRATYHLNSRMSGRVFPECEGGCLISAERVIDWRYFFDLAKDHPPQPSRRMDARLVHPLIDVPESVIGKTDVLEYHSLAVRDLLRGNALGLPSGESISREMGVDPLTHEEVGLEPLVGWEGETPLWYYILKESDLREDGDRLGPVGARIVAEVLVELLDADPQSYRAMEPDWTPVLPSSNEDDFTMADLLRVAGVG